MDFSKSIPEIVRQRFSCRAYLDKPLDAAEIASLRAEARGLIKGPLGSPVQFDLLAASADDAKALKGVGAYGAIKKPQAYFVGAVSPENKGLEDFGFVLEELVLRATDMGIGSCWIGGVFSKSNFAKKINASAAQTVPAVISLGYIENVAKARNSLARRTIGAINRIPWEQQFFNATFGNPITVEQAGGYTTPLEMVRLGPSASNKQPWRIVKIDHCWHFFVQRTKGYGDGFVFKLFKLADLQRVDVGIAMCHFELAALHQGLIGEWTVKEPAIEKPQRTEYIASWVGSK